MWLVVSVPTSPPVPTPDPAPDPDSVPVPSPASDPDPDPDPAPDPASSPVPVSTPVPTPSPCRDFAKLSMISSVMSRCCGKRDLEPFFVRRVSHGNEEFSGGRERVVTTVREWETNKRVSIEEREVDLTKN